MGRGSVEAGVSTALRLRLLALVGGVIVLALQCSGWDDPTPDYVAAPPVEKEWPAFFTEAEPGPGTGRLLLGTPRAPQEVDLVIEDCETDGGRLQIAARTQDEQLVTFEGRSHHVVGFSWVTTSGVQASGTGTAASEGNRHQGTGDFVLGEAVIDSEYWFDLVCEA